MRLDSAHREEIGGEQSLRRRFRSCGILILRCDPRGALQPAPVDGHDWFEGLCRRSLIFRRALGDAATRWETEPTPTAVEAMPGLWLAPAPVTARRRRLGYSVAVITTGTLLKSEQLDAMCQSAECDRTLTARRLAGLPPVAESEVERLSHMLRFAWHDQEQIQAGADDCDETSEQLAASYEEISLLYTIIQRMRVVERPSRFVNIICEELLGTLSFAWVGVRFAEEDPMLNRLAGRLFLAGEPQTALERLDEPARELIARVKTEGPLILEPEARQEDARYRILGRTAVVHPITIEERVVGIVIAGDKRGPDPAVSSGDQKLIDATASNAAIFLENAALYEDLNRMFLGTLEALTASIDAKDPYTAGHSQRVAYLTRVMAGKIGLDEHTVDRMHIAGLVHDIGKIGVPEPVLLKPGKLTEDEFAWIRRHPEIGHRILKDIPRMDDILPGVLYHHERWDGRGYPSNLETESIPLVARIIALADSFDAMSSDRTYRAARSRSEVIEEIRRSAGTQFDPVLAPVFAALDFGRYDEMVREHKAIGDHDANEAVAA